MRKRNYRAGVAAVLVGAVLFSPLLCGMTCLETRGIRPSVEAEAGPAPWEFVAEFVGTGIVGCVLTHVVLRVDVGEWKELARVGSWFWVGVEIVRFVEGR